MDNPTRDETLHRLYAEMPNAQQLPEDERGKLWGEVEHTPEYYFCSTVAREIDALKAENERLRVALEPFAALGAVVDTDGDIPPRLSPKMMGALRNARAALSKAEASK